MDQQFELLNGLDSDQNVTIHYDLQVDSFLCNSAATFASKEIPRTGQSVATGSVSVAVSSQKQAVFALKSPQNIGSGAYLLGLEIAYGTTKEAQWFHLFVRPASSVDTERTRRFGINASEIKLAEEMRRCGFGWVRFENGKWNMFSTARDKYAFDGSVPPWHVSTDQIFTTYQKLGIKVLPYVFQTPEWATTAPVTVDRNRAGYPPKDPADYGEAVYQLVARQGHAPADPTHLLTADKKSAMNVIDAVELWNEPNLNDPGWGPFVGPLSLYFDVMRAGAEGSRRADPTMPVSAAGWAGIGLDVVGLLAEHRYSDGKRPLDFIDIVNVHFYSGREEPEICGWDPNVDRASSVHGGSTFPEQLEDLAEWRDRNKPKAEIWLSETGNDVGGPIGLTEWHQAAKVPRAVMLALASGIDKVFIYREKGSDPSMHAGAGLLRNDLSVRPVWFTVATMIRQLQGFEGRTLRLPASNPKAWLFLWEEGSRKVITGWTYEGKWKLGIDLGKVSVSDAFGHVTTLDSTADLQLGEFPTYITLLNPGSAFKNWTSEARKQTINRSNQRTSLAALTACLFDFGPPGQPIGILKGYGLPKRFVPISKDTVWDENQGYGFANPAMSNEDRRWIGDPLDRDGCKLEPHAPFRFSLPSGTFKVQISAEPLGGEAIDVIFKTANGNEERKKAGTKIPPPEFTVATKGEIVEISLSGYGLLKWISATVPIP